MSDAAPLAGHAVLVTRPQAQADTLCGRLRALGAQPVPLPTLLIGPPNPSPGLEANLTAAPRADWVIFVSRNAVHYGLRLLHERGLSLNPRARLVTVGGGTAQALREHGLEVFCTPGRGFDSEALLEMPQFSAGRGESVLIFRGEGGRPLLGETLRRRGAKVSYAEVYRRELPRTEASPALRQWRDNGTRWVLATSQEGLANLLQMAGDAGDELRQARLLVVSHRIADQARGLGWVGPVILTSEPGDEGVIEAMVTAVRGGHDGRR
jgi:uroporphyrinogen-III synthase